MIDKNRKKIVHFLISQVLVQPKRNRSRLEYLNTFHETMLYAYVSISATRHLFLYSNQACSSQIKKSQQKYITEH